MTLEILVSNSKKSYENCHCWGDVHYHGSGSVLWSLTVVHYRRLAGVDRQYSRKMHAFLDGVRTRSLMRQRMGSWCARDSRRRACGLRPGVGPPPPCRAADPVLVSAAAAYCPPNLPASSGGQAVRRPITESCEYRQRRRPHL
ncbi:hypothetical protein EVAR_3249_1 [Eumeta japonica]|uniref:Uncharacterized protein n=1 Tax=Eumeta variegata TaxID=151549 RepID=A0A4C1SXJ4_EUMVA|nr:hypothetical protein EVAR_3249_1 [Eumeta japonica]